MAASEFIKDTAKALVFISGINFDFFATEEADLTEEETNELMNEIQNFCKAGLKRLEKKYNIDIPVTSTEAVIDAIMYE